MDIQPFKVAIPDAAIDELNQRLVRTRWPDEIPDSDWEYGANLDYMRALVGYWHDRFDWRAQERKINAFANFRAEVEGLGIHFIHERGKGKHPIPLMLIHGWPSSFAEMLDIIPLLTDPANHGGKAEDAFDVIVPSVPGYGFSDRPHMRGVTRYRVADLLVRLMVDLGYDRFAVHANDIGAVIAGFMGLDHPGNLIGIHTLMPNVPPPFFGAGSRPMSEAEKQFVQTQEAWGREEGGYNLIQETRPQTLAYSLNDSPAGLAAWIIEKWRAWSASGASFEQHFTKDFLLTNVAIYWFTETANSSSRSYYERAHYPRPPKPEDRITVPTGVALTAEEVQRVPREWVERIYTDIRHWTEFGRGGHFFAAEEPEMLVADLRTFFRQLR